MFSALSGTTPIAAWEIDITTRHDETFTCPECGEPVVARCGEHMPWHFAHKASSDCPRIRFGESAEHAWAKFTLGKTMAAAGYSVAVEEPLGELRRPDLTVVSPVTGRWCTVEIQSSHIDANEMRWRWAHDHEAGATDTLWVWVGKPSGLGEQRNVFLGEDIRYYMQTTRCSLSTVTGGKFKLAGATAAYWLCRDCSIWTTGPTCPGCGISRVLEHNDDYGAFTLVEATGLPVVCNGARWPVVRFGAVATDTVVDNRVEAL